MPQGTAQPNEKNESGGHLKSKEVSAVECVGKRLFTGVICPGWALIELFRGLPSSNINDKMNRLYCMHDSMHLLNASTAGPLLGVAITVKAPIGDNLLFHQALDMACPGNVGSGWSKRL